VSVGDRRVHVGPEGFCGLQFRGIGWEMREADALGHDEWRGVPTGAVESVNAD